jgi:hypothetical protein
MIMLFLITTKTTRKRHKYRHVRTSQKETYENHITETCKSEMAGREFSQLLGLSYNQVTTSIRNINWDQLGKNTIGVTIAAGQGLENALGHAQTAGVNVDWGKLGKGAATAAVAAGEGLGKTFQHVETAVRKTDWAEVGRDISATVRNNPKTVLIPVGVVGGAVTGGLLMGPVLGAVGFSSIGPVAGKKVFVPPSDVG